MKMRSLVVCLISLLLINLVACSPAASKEVSVDITSSGKEVTLTVGDTLTVTLDSNKTTGYSWNENATISDSTVIQQEDHKYNVPETSAPVVGAGGKEVWTFKSLKAGKSIISMEYRQPWMTNSAPAKTFSLTVNIK
ncbi:MAG: protease inhibitor I42 family protein [Chloroflexi bacterium]|nr:protease inhibitor I42 family protein [Chloroflexota bacterium]